jgi:gliding motility-associated-like protein
MKKLFPISAFLLLSNVLYSQLIYYVRPNLPSSSDETFYFGVFDVQTCKDSTLFQIKNTAGIFTIDDIAVCPNGDFYLSLYNYNFPYQQIGKLNMQDSSLIILANYDAGNSMVCDGNGLIWSGPNLNTFDTNSGQINSYGYIGYDLGGDLTFRDGKLFGTTINNELIEIDTANLNLTYVVYQYPLNDIVAFGIVSDSKSCDSTLTYITTTNLGVSSTIDSINAIYAIDPVAQTMTFVCNTPHAMWGATTPTEFLASNCSLQLDLDADDSSGATGSDWQAPLLCTGSTVALADTDATWYSGYHTDSMRVRLLAPAPDQPQEYLSATGFGSVSVSGQGSGQLTLLSAGNTAVPVSNADFQTVLRSLAWHNDAAPKTPGPRTVELVAFCSGGRRDTAYSYLTVPILLSAGQDTVFSVCADGMPFALLAPGGDAGGTWSATAAGSGVFSPQLDLPATYTYSVDNTPCPADTAEISVGLLPLPAFSLGQDTSLCIGAAIVLNAPGNAAWQDGSYGSSFNVDASGLYWAAYTDANGCSFQDSVVVVFKPGAQGQSAAQQCAGHPFNWNGLSFTSDTTVCQTFTAANGCDSLHCLSLTFYIPSLSLDTSICSGQTMNWLGTNYQQGGIYRDTVMLNGCLTATRLELTVSPPDTVARQAVICEGETYAVGAQQFSATGIYAVPFQTALGCDSTVLLDLQVQPSVQSGFSVSICPGSTYLFDGNSIAQAGMYAAQFQTAAGCDSTVTLSLSLHPAPMPMITGDTLICPGSVGILSVGNFSSIEWSGGEGSESVTVTQPGSYSVTVVDGNGCTASSSAAMMVLPPIQATWMSADPSCHGGSDGFVELTAVSGAVEPLQFSLNQGAIVSSGIFDGLPAGLQEITITDSQGCTAVFDLLLDNPPLLAVDLGPAQTLEVGQSYPIPVSINQSGTYTYAWSPPNGLSCIDCPNPVATAIDSTVYALLLTSGAGCTASDSLLILVIKGEGVYIPQIFSPNADGQNESFTVYGDLSLVELVEVFQIFDRWGELVFDRESMSINDETSGWNGSFRGRLVLPGVYVWYARVRMLNGTVVLKKGDVTVVR